MLNVNRLPDGPRLDPAFARAHRGLLLRLLLAADRHAPSVAGVVGVSASAILHRLRAKSVRAQWARVCEQNRRADARALQRRRNWRHRFKKMGIDPHALHPTDPAWAYCHRYPRGYVVRVVAAQMRAERPGIVLAEPTALVELLDRVEALVAAGPAHPALVNPPPGVH